jgi:hypothetical protein
MTTIKIQDEPTRDAINDIVHTKALELIERKRAEEAGEITPPELMIEQRKWISAHMTDSNEICANHPEMIGHLRGGRR